MLTGYQTPDPFSPVYARRALDVGTALNLVRWASYDPTEWLDGGGDGGAPLTALRSRMLPTAFFSQGVVTDSAGEATVRFRLPDNVTRWRVMAVATDRGQRFGRGEGAIAASKPLQVLPALPRFLTEGDFLDAGFVVHNQTGAAADAQVKLTVKGADLVGPSEQKLTLAAGAQAPLRFGVMARRRGEVSLQIEVVAGEHSDRLEVRLPVHAAAERQHLLVADGALDEASTGRSFAIPEDAREGTAELVVTASATRLSSLEPSVSALLDYPHGCAEQKTSRLVAMVSLGGLVKDLALSGLDESGHRAKLEETLLALEKHQNGDGGFGLWVEDDSDPFITAYVLFGMTVARSHGYVVGEGVTDPAFAYLQAKIRDGELAAGYFEYDPKVFTAYLLALAKKDDLGLAEKLYAVKDTLSRFEQGLLAAALVGRDGDKANVMLDELSSGAKARDEGRLVAETQAPTHYEMGSDVRATAALVTALTLAGRDRDAGPLISGMLALRESDGTWGTTHNNLWALHAIGGYSEPPAGPATVRVRIGDRAVGEITLAKQGGAGTLVVPASALPAPGNNVSLTVATTAPAAAARFTIRVRYDATRTRARSDGYALTREVLDATTGDPVTRPRIGQLLRVRVNVNTDAARHQVAVTDRLPAGLEPIDNRLKTSRTAEDPTAGVWRSFEVRDDRVSFFAHSLAAGTYRAEYVARVSRSGELIWPAATAESMYDPTQRGNTAATRFTVDR